MQESRSLADHFGNACFPKKASAYAEHPDTVSSRFHDRLPVCASLPTMHPQLDRVRFDTCESLMDALEECHRQEFVKQALGMCNFEKDELAKCLHHTRINDANERIKQARQRQKEYEKRRQQREEEMYGKNNYLKKMIEQEAAKGK